MALLGPIYRAMDCVSSGIGSVIAFFECLAGLGEEWWNSLGRDTVIGHELEALLTLEKAKPDVALTLFETDELGDIGRRDPMERLWGCGRRVRCRGVGQLNGYVV